MTWLRSQHPSVNGAMSLPFEPQLEIISNDVISIKRPISLVSFNVDLKAIMITINGFFFLMRFLSRDSSALILLVVHLSPGD